MVGLQLMFYHNDEAWRMLCSATCSWALPTPHWRCLHFRHVGHHRPPWGHQRLCQGPSPRSAHTSPQPLAHGAAGFPALSSPLTDSKTLAMAHETEWKPTVPLRIAVPRTPNSYLGQVGESRSWLLLTLTEGPGELGVSLGFNFFA